MKLSILITSFNKGKYLEDCIISCLQQDYQDFEVILFDNESNDKSGLILEKYNNKIKVVKKSKISKFGALNQIDLLVNAFNISKGEIICLLDGDDYFKKDKLSNVNRAFEIRKNIDVIFDIPTVKNDKEQYKFKIKNKFQKEIWPTIIPTSSISVKREALQKIINSNLFYNFEYLEIDFRINTLYRNLYKNNFLITDENLTFYRIVNDGIMSKMKKFSSLWWIKRFQAHKFMEDLYSKHGKKYNNKLDYFFSKIFSSF